MKRLAVLCLIVALSTLSLPGLAEPINQQQQNQGDRIHQGVESGSLTKREAVSLAHQERSLKRKEQAYRSNGKLTHLERVDLQTDLNQLNRRIYRQKHDKQSRD